LPDAARITRSGPRTYRTKLLIEPLAYAADSEERPLTARLIAVGQLSSR